MTYNQEHMLFQWGGEFRNGTAGPLMDTFVGSMRFVGPQLEVADNDEAMAALLLQLRGFWINAAGGVPGMANLQWVKWNKIGTDGRYVYQSGTREMTVAPTAYGSVQTVYPLQICCAVTWTTDLSRGRASKGRTYFPTALPVTATSNARLTTAAQTSMATAAYSLIQNWNTALSDLGSGLRAAVMSNMDEGKSALIKGARVGNRLDIQRRRDNAVPETYVERPDATGSA